MSFLKFVRGAVVGLACWGLVVPHAVFAQEKNTTARTAQMTDVKLANGGVLRGRVVNAQGKALANTTVLVSYNGQVIARTNSSASGTYAVKGLRGGLHQVTAGSQSNVVRLWTASAAPKSARTEVLSVAGSVVRGQYGGEYCPPGDMGGYPMDGGACPPGAAMDGYGGGAGFAGAGGAGFAGAGAAGGGFGMLDVITLATVGTSAAALVYALDNNDKLDDLEDALQSP